MLSRMLTLTLIVIPALVQHAHAGLFTSESPVKMLDGSKGFKNAMRENRTAIVAFVAPWCGHCQKLTPEYEKAAKRLKPLVPLYAVDCDAEHNKRLCAEQGVRGFPTLKIFKKGLRSPGIEYQGPRVQNDIYNWGKSAVPNTLFKVRTGVEGVHEWSFKAKDKPRAILLNKSNKLPLLWVVLSNQFDKKIDFATVRDRRGIVSKAMGFPYNEEHRKPKVVVYPPGSREPLLYEGLLKYEPLSDFFGQFAKGKADLSKLLSSLKEEKEAMPEMEMRKQEADAIMQGKGYGNPHAGMQVGDDGLPVGDMHDGHSGADYMKAIKDSQEAAKNPVKEKPLEFSEAHFEGFEMGEEGEEMVGEGGGYRDMSDEL